MRNGVWVGTRSGSPLPMAGHDAVPAAALPLYGRQERREAEGPDYCGGVTAVEERDIDPVVAASFEKGERQDDRADQKGVGFIPAAYGDHQRSGIPDGNRSTRPPGARLPPCQTHSWLNIIMYLAFGVSVCGQRSLLRSTPGYAREPPAFLALELASLSALVYSHSWLNFMRTSPPSGSLNVIMGRIAFSRRFLAFLRTCELPPNGDR